jgi:NitT/TauT family transport system substrate-binding protein
MKRISLLVFCFLFVFTSACGGKSSSLKKLEFALGYIPNIQFAPVYVAINNGYFAGEGLEIEIVHMDENQAAALVGAGELPFAVVSGEQVLLARAQGLPIVYVAAWYEEYPVSVISLAESDITSPFDLYGQTIGLPGLYGANYIGLRALLHAGGLTEEQVTLDSIGYTQLEALVTGRDPVVAVYTANEPVQLRADGYEITELRVADFADLAGNGIIVSEDTLQNDPELVRSFVRAFLHGLTETAADPAAAYTISQDFVETLTADDPVQQEVLATSISLWAVQNPGWSEPIAWENTLLLLLDMGLLGEFQDIYTAFTNDYLPTTLKIE